MDFVTALDERLKLVRRTNPVAFVRRIRNTWGDEKQLHKAPVAVIMRYGQADLPLRPPALIAARAARWPRWWRILRRVIGRIVRRIVLRIARRVWRRRRLISTLLKQSDGEQPAERRKTDIDDAYYNQEYPRLEEPFRLRLIRALLNHLSYPLLKSRIVTHLRDSKQQIFLKTLPDVENSKRKADK